jgi:hypothetical protein
MYSGRTVGRRYAGVSRRSSRHSAALEMICTNLPRVRRVRLRQLGNSSFSIADTAACLLGENLWYPPLAEYRDYLSRSGERPHLWGFTFGPSAAWRNDTWHGLSLTARVVRARIGSLATETMWLIAPSTIGCDHRTLRRALDELQAAGMCALAHNRCICPAIASASDLTVDLHLTLIIEHWLQMLEHADRIVKDLHATGYEVHGYSEACAACRERWGVRPRALEWIPPFHPGCRCFAQPRYAASALAPP